VHKPLQTGKAKGKVMGLIPVTEAGAAWDERRYEELEAGNILFFARSPVRFSEEEQGFLLGQRQPGAAYHKNIAYCPAQDVLTGVAAGADRDRLKVILRNFSAQTVELLARLMPHYAASWRVDFTSFRPLEEAGRSLSVHARNGLLHVDAFPTRPTNGGRILRSFSNINPRQLRVWITGDAFQALAEKLKDEARLACDARRLASPRRRRDFRSARVDSGRPRR
jgi:3-deoxy-D-manno-oct-2-ulosonic acid (Kdo) hydroxylase